MLKWLTKQPRAQLVGENEIILVMNALQMYKGMTHDHVHPQIDNLKMRLASSLRKSR